MRRVLVAMLVLAMPAAAPAQRIPAENWTIEQRGGCRVVGTDRPGRRLEWSGACRDGIGEGAGTLSARLPDGSGSRIEGTLRAGRFLGPRRVVLTDRRGREVFISVEGPTGEGRLRGEIHFPGGSRYRGEFRTPGFVPDGSGQMQYASGNSYEGSWRDGMADGWGSARSAAGRDFAGLFRRGCLAEGGPMIGIYNQPTSMRCSTTGLGPARLPPGGFEDRWRPLGGPR